MNQSIFRFFKVVAIIVSAIAALIIFGIIAYDKGLYTISSTDESVESQKVQKTIKGKAPVESSVKSVPKPAPPKEDPFTKEKLQMIDNLFDGIYLNAPVMYFHKKELYQLIIGKKFQYEKIDIWIKKALPEASKSEVELIYTRIVKLRQKILQEK